VHGIHQVFLLFRVKVQWAIPAEAQSRVYVKGSYLANGAIDPQDYVG